MMDPRFFHHHLGSKSINKVEVSGLKANIRSKKFVQFQFNLVDTCDKIMVDYEFIVDRGGR